jgi:hypothetical protein
MLRLQVSSQRATLVAQRNIAGTPERFAVEAVQVELEDRTEQVVQTLHPSEIARCLQRLLGRMSQRGQKLSWMMFSQEVRQDKMGIEGNVVVEVEEALSSYPVISHVACQVVGVQVEWSTSVAHVVESCLATSEVGCALHLMEHSKPQMRSSQSVDPVP